MKTIMMGEDQENNICLKTDSYKINHWNQYPFGTQFVYSYFECRKGGQFPVTPFFGLQAILLKHFVGQVVTKEMIDKAEEWMGYHFGNKNYFNRQGWEYILKQYGGKLPLTIKAVPEGTPVPESNVLLTVENTDDKCYWLTNSCETLLSQVWYPTTVCALSRATKNIINKYLQLSAENNSGLPFMLHDFGYRGVSSNESAGFGGAAHLVNFLGTDTLASFPFAVKYYKANPQNFAFSVAATEHSVMTAEGEFGEPKIVERLMREYPNGILSVVSDSYDIYHFVDNIIGKKFKDRILKRGGAGPIPHGIFVVRPDSVTPTHTTPESEMVWILESLWKNFGGTTNSKGYRLIDPHIRALWGDGIDINGIDKILKSITDAKFSAENIATFGMGGGLLQKVNRDTQRCAFKSSAQCRKGTWLDIYKKPKDDSKVSKRGKLKLVWHDGAHGKYLTTVSTSDIRDDVLETVFENGELMKFYTFDEIRKNSEVKTIYE